MRAAQCLPQGPLQVRKKRRDQSLRAPEGAVARAGRAARRRSAAGGPCGSSGRPATGHPALSAQREPSALGQRLHAFRGAWRAPRPEGPLGPWASAGGSASGGRPGRPGGRRHSARSPRWEQCRAGSAGPGSRGGSGGQNWRRGWCATSVTAARGVRYRPPPQRAGERPRQHVPPRDAGVDSWAAGSRGKPPGGWCRGEVVAAGGPAMTITTCWLPGDSLMLCSVKTVAVSCGSCQENQHTFV